MRGVVVTCLSIASVLSIALAYSTLYCLICVNNDQKHDHENNKCPDPIAYDIDTIKYVANESFESMRCGVAVIIISVIEILNKYF